MLISSLVFRWCIVNAAKHKKAMKNRACSAAEQRGACENSAVSGRPCQGFARYIGDKLGNGRGGGKTVSKKRRGTNRRRFLPFSPANVLLDAYGKAPVGVTLCPAYCGPLLTSRRREVIERHGYRKKRGKKKRSTRRRRRLDSPRAVRRANSCRGREENNTRTGRE